MPRWNDSIRACPWVDSGGVRILQVDERRVTEPGFGVHWTSDLAVRSVPELSGDWDCVPAGGPAEAEVILLEVSDRPAASVVAIAGRLRSLGVPLALRLHRASGEDEAPLGSALEALIGLSDLTFFGGRGELVRVASELAVSPRIASLAPSPIHLPAELGTTGDGGVVGMGFSGDGLPPGIRAIDSVQALRLEVMACKAVAMGPLMGSGSPALTEGLLARGIAVVAPRAQAALDGYPPRGWGSVPGAASEEAWQAAVSQVQAPKMRRVSGRDRWADRWFGCLRDLTQREVLTCD